MVYKFSILYCHQNYAFVQNFEKICSRERGQKLILRFHLYKQTNSIKKNLWKITDQIENKEKLKKPDY